MTDLTGVQLSRRTLLLLGGALAAAGCSSSSATRSSSTPDSSAAAESAPGAASSSPIPGSTHATAVTEVSFRGVEAADVSGLTLSGSSSGAHTFALKPHGDGNGVSALPDKPFVAGETVTVTHGIDGLAGSTGGAHSFVVADTLATATQPLPATSGTAPATWSYVSEPSLTPVKYDVDLSSGTPSPGLFATTPSGFGVKPCASLIDDAGEVAWYYPAPAGSGILNLNVQTFEGKPVLTYWQGAVKLPGIGFGDYHLMDATYTPITSFKAGNGCDGDIHEFKLTEGGTAFVTNYVATRMDLTPYGGKKDGVVLDCVAQEIEPRTGRVLWDWHCLDHVDLSESWNPITIPGQLDLGQWDAFHMNSIEPYDDEHVLISLRAVHCVLKVARSTGAVVWRLGGKKGDFSLGTGVAFHSQHDARWHGDGVVSLFDNGSGAGDGDNPHAPRGLVLDVDESAMKATVKLSMASPVTRKAKSNSQGSNRLVEDGHWVVGWGSGAAYTEFDATGKALLDTDLTNAIQSYRTPKGLWDASPTTTPAVAVKDGKAYVSWNGATKVAGWRLSSGASAGALTAAKDVARSGFETALDVPAGAAFVAVAAVDSGGTVLATSRTVTV